MVEVGSGKLVFVGKDFYIFNSLAYYIVFGLVIILHYLTVESFLSVVFCILLFFLTIGIASSIESWLRITECTACNNGIRQLMFGQVPYERIVISSLLISVIPDLLLYYNKVRKRSGAIILKGLR